MHRSLAQCSTPVSFVHAPSWADFTTTTSELKFSVHTGKDGDIPLPVLWVLLVLWKLAVLIARAEPPAWHIRLTIGMSGAWTAFAAVTEGGRENGAAGHDGRTQPAALRPRAAASLRDGAVRIEGWQEADALDLVRLSSG